MQIAAITRFGHGELWQLPHKPGRAGFLNLETGLRDVYGKARSTQRARIGEAAPEALAGLVWPQPQLNGAEALMRKEDLECLETALRQIDHRQRSILLDRYQNNLTLEQIGQKHRCSKERVRQIVLETVRHVQFAIQRQERHGVGVGSLADAVGMRHLYTCDTCRCSSAQGPPCRFCAGLEEAKRTLICEQEGCALQRRLWSLCNGRIECPRCFSTYHPFTHRRLSNPPDWWLSKREENRKAGLFIHILERRGAMNGHQMALAIGITPRRLPSLIRYAHQTGMLADRGYHLDYEDRCRLESADVHALERMCFALSQE
jgi:hypothetical protein